MNFLMTLSTFLQNKLDKNLKFSKMVEFSKFQKIFETQEFFEVKIENFEIIFKNSGIFRNSSLLFCNFPIQHLINCFVRSMFLCSLQKKKLNQIKFRIMWEFLEIFENLPMNI
jgi:hypothetical protein